MATILLASQGGSSREVYSDLYWSTPIISAEEDEGQGPYRRLYPLWLGLLYSCTRVAPAGALFKKKKQPETLDAFSGRVVKLYWPIMANLGFSGAIGLACGLALRVGCLSLS